jgi:orotidine-5'-phosphate decarboxylase
MLTLHLSGGRAMIEAAARTANPEMLLLGVTVLTSVDAATLREIGIDAPIEEQVLRLAKLGAESGIRGFVASPHEVAPLRLAHGSKMKIVTPGIRPSGSLADDQRRAMTPAEAFTAGADFLVIGRPITAAQNPRAAFEQIVADAL